MPLFSLEDAKKKKHGRAALSSYLWRSRETEGSFPRHFVGVPTADDDERHFSEERYDDGHCHTHSRAVKPTSRKDDAVEKEF